MDLEYTLFINQLEDTDYIATIQNSNSSITSENDLGDYFNLTGATIKHSILDLNAITTFDLTINSLFEQAYNSKNRTDLDATFQTSDTNRRNELSLFLSTLVGRTVQMIVTIPETIDNGSFTKTIFSGYIEKKPSSISVKSGSQFTLSCRTSLSQLKIMSSNSSWDDTTKTFGNVFSTVGANQIDKNIFFNAIVQNTLLNISSNKQYIKSNFQFKDLGSFPPLPNKLWALIVPNKPKLEIIREILIAYNRIVWQSEDGIIYVQPLYINDYSSSIYDVDVENNNQNNWMSKKAMNNATNTINRIDVVLAVPALGSYYGNTTIDTQNSQIFASAPFTNRDTNEIERLPSTDSLIDYTDIYKSSVRLYNTGKWKLPAQRPVSIDDALSDAIMINLLAFKYKYNNIWFSNNIKSNNWASFYAQLFLAEENVTNYNCQIDYDYNVVAREESPLCKIITINNELDIDFPQMICTETTLSFTVAKGSILSINTAPLLSITAAWDELPRSTFVLNTSTL